MRGSGCVKPSPLRSRESAQCIPDVINLELELVSEGEVEDSENEVKMMGVLCLARNKRWNDYFMEGTT